MPVACDISASLPVLAAAGSATLAEQDRSGRPWSRRAVLAGGTGAALVALVRPVRALELPAPLAFTVRRKGSVIGEHVATFADEGGTLRVESRVDLRVKLAFVTLFSFRQDAVDRFENAVLVASDVRTDDDGERTRVEARAGDGELRVAGPAGENRAPLGVLTDLCFWDKRIVLQDQLVDSKTGEVSPLQRSAGARETIPVLGSRVTAERFDLVTSNRRSGTVWYDGSGRLVRAVVKTRGEVLDYELQA